MELTPLQVTQLRAACSHILAILSEVSPRAVPELDALIHAWVTEHLRYAPGHRVDCRDVVAQFQRDSGIVVSSQMFGLRVGLPKQRSNGRTYYLGVKLV